MKNRACIAAMAIVLAATPCLAQDAGVGRPYSLVTEAWPPFRMNDGSAPSGFIGIDIDIALELERRLGIAIEIQRRPWARALEMMKSGEADLVTGIARTDERESYMAYVGVPYAAVQPVFYALKGKGSAIGTYDDLYGKSIGFSLNSAYFEPFNSDSMLTKVGLSTEEQILKVLSLGRIDVAIGTDPNMSWDVARLGYRDALERTSYRPTVRTDLYIAISRKSSAVALAPDIERALKVMVSDGTIEAIVEKYR